jgi:hypothetical protein
MCVVLVVEMCYCVSCFDAACDVLWFEYIECCVVSKGVSRCLALWVEGLLREVLL